MEKNQGGALTSSSSLRFRRCTFTKVMELQHWKIFTPGMAVICKTSACRVRRGCSALCGGRVFRTSRRLCILRFKRQEPASSFLPFSPPAFPAFFSPLHLLTPLFHLGLPPPKVLIKMILNWPQDSRIYLPLRVPHLTHCVPLSLRSVSRVQQRTAKGFCRKTKQQTRVYPILWAKKRGWFGVLPPDSH